MLVNYTLSFNSEDLPRYQYKWENSLLYFMLQPVIYTLMHDADF